LKPAKTSSICDMDKEESIRALETRLKIEGTVDQEVYNKVKEIFHAEIDEAHRNDRPEPSLSWILEMLLRKGIRAWEKERK